MLSNDHDQGSVLGGRSTRGIKNPQNPFSYLDTDKNNLAERDDLLMQKREMTQWEGMESLAWEWAPKAQTGTAPNSHREGLVYGQRIYPPDKTVGALGHLCWQSFFSLTRKQGYQLREGREGSERGLKETMERTSVIWKNDGNLLSRIMGRH